MSSFERGVGERGFDEPDESLYEVPAEDIHGWDAPAKARADDHLRWYSYWQTQQDDIEAQYQLQLKRLQDWHHAKTEQVQAKRLFHADVLRRFHQAVLERDGRQKTIVLPNGTLRSVTRTKPSVVVTDSHALTEWCLAHEPGLLLMKPQVVKARLDTYCASGSEPLPDGVVVADPVPSFTVVLDDGMEPE